MKRIPIFILTILALLAFIAPTHAQSPINITANTFTNNFRQNLTFRLDATSSAKITDVALFIQLDGIASSSRWVPEFTADSKIQASYAWNLNQKYLPPGVTGKFWWTLEDSAGNKAQTDKEPFRVEDASKKWSKLSTDQFAFYWYAGGDNFGKRLYDAATAGLNAVTADTNTRVPRQLQIFIYGNRQDFVNAMDPGMRDWTGGRAFSEYGITLIHIEPNALNFGLRAVPHELAHLVLHQKLGDLGVSALPHWMNEGLATYYETVPPTMDEDYARALKPAVQNDKLLPMRTIMGNFPTASDQAILAYAQSYSMTDFIVRKYSRAKYAALLDGFKNPRYFDDIFREVLGVDHDGLENEWRKDLGLQPRAIATRSTAQPTAFPTFSLSSDPVLPTRAPTTAGAQAATPVPPTSVAQAATPAPTTVAQVATPAPAPTPKPASNNPLAGICGGLTGFIALGLFGAMRAWSRFRGE
jgi:hypothetical protein